MNAPSDPARTLQPRRPRLNSTPSSGAGRAGLGAGSQAREDQGKAGQGVAGGAAGYGLREGSEGLRATV